MSLNVPSSLNLDFFSFYFSVTMRFVATIFPLMKRWYDLCLDKIFELPLSAGSWLKGFYSDLSIIFLNSIRV